MHVVADACHSPCLLIQVGFMLHEGDVGLLAHELEIEID